MHKFICRQILRLLWMELKKRISRIVNVKSLKSKVIHQFQWSDEFCNNIIDEYFKFLAIKVLKNDHRSSKFGCSWILDKVWLYHLSDHKEYSMDCSWICHDFIEYHCTSQEQLDATLEVYSELFVEVPKIYWALNYNEGIVRNDHKIDIVLKRNANVDKMVFNHVYSAFTETHKIQIGEVKHIRIGIKFQDHRPIYFKIHPFEQCKKLFKSFALYRGIKMKYYCFTYKKTVISQNQKIIHLGIKDKEFFICYKKAELSLSTPPEDNFANFGSQNNAKVINTQTPFQNEE